MCRLLVDPLEILYSKTLHFTLVTGTFFAPLLRTPNSEGSIYLAPSGILKHKRHIARTMTGPEPFSDPSDSGGGGRLVTLLKYFQTTDVKWALSGASSSCSRSLFC
jgi:hypothetical protein